MTRPMLSLLTDFEALGRASGGAYVAQVKAAILTINPEVQLIDVAHDIPPQDILAGAWLLRDVAEVFPQDAIHIAVVDPGVGSDRALIAVKTDRGTYVAPDNGLVSLVAADFPPLEIRELTNSSFWRPRVSCTFHGRDILGPVAAHLSLGVPLERVGPRRTDLIRIQTPQPAWMGEVLVGQVVRVDTYGNLITNIRRADLEARGGVDVNDAAGLAHWSFELLAPQSFECLHAVCGLSSHYASAPADSVIALIGSTDRLEIAVVGGDAGRVLQFPRGGQVRVTRDLRSRQ